MVVWPCGGLCLLHRAGAMHLFPCRHDAGIVRVLDGLPREEVHCHPAAMGVVGGDHEVPALVADDLRLAEAEVFALVQVELLVVHPGARHEWPDILEDFGPGLLGDVVDLLGGPGGHLKRPKRIRQFVRFAHDGAEDALLLQGHLPVRRRWLPCAAVFLQDGGADLAPPLPCLGGGCCCCHVAFSFAWLVV